MVEIKEEDISVTKAYRWRGMGTDSHYYYPDFDRLKIKAEELDFSKEQAEQLKQQILQDHEDAKKYHEDRHKIVESFKKWEQRNKETEKNRQIVKRLEEKLKEWIKPIKNNDGEFYDLEFIIRVDKLIQQILEEKK